MARCVGILVELNADAGIFRVDARIVPHFWQYVCRVVRRCSLRSCCIDKGKAKIVVPLSSGSPFDTM
jgi:hypothetical protein